MVDRDEPVSDRVENAAEKFDFYLGSVEFATQEFSPSPIRRRIGYDKYYSSGDTSMEESSKGYQSNEEDWSPDPNINVIDLDPETQDFPEWKASLSEDDIPVRLGSENPQIIIPKNDGNVVRNQRSALKAKTGTIQKYLLRSKRSKIGGKIARDSKLLSKLQSLKSSVEMLEASLDTQKLHREIDAAHNVILNLIEETNTISAKVKSHFSNQEVQR